MNKNKLLLIVPAYNEGDNLISVMDEIARDSGADALIVDDGSTDHTKRLIEERGWRAVSLPINMGLSCAVETGMRYALAHGYEYAMQFDGDGQHIARYVPEMLNYARVNDLDVVIGARSGRVGGLRGVGARFLSFIVRATTGHVLTDSTSGMRLFSSRVLSVFVNSMNLRPEPDALAYIIRSGARVGEYPVEMRERLSGASYLSAMRSVRYMIEMGVSILVMQPIRERKSPIAGRDK